MKKAIGIAGGMGPLAGFDLARKICANTIAARDQDHIPLVLFSIPSKITDRTEFLLGRSEKNPAFAIASTLMALSKAGASVAGIPCNTAHAPPVFDIMLEILKTEKCEIRVLNIIEETCAFAREKNPGLKCIGLLATSGSAKTGTFQQTFERTGVNVLTPDDSTQEMVHSAIYDPEKGIKTVTTSENTFASQILTNAANDLVAGGAQAIVLGCTEIPLVINARHISGVSVFDPSEILARALIRETFPEKLKPVNFYDINN